MKMVSKSSEEDLIKIYHRAEDYFKNKTEGFVVESPSVGKYFNFRKRGSDLTFRLIIGEHDLIHLEVIKIDCTMDGGNVFSKSVAGTFEYHMNGECENKRKFCLPYKRQQLELQEVIEHVQRSIRPNSINFIMDD